MRILTFTLLLWAGAGLAQTAIDERRDAEPDGRVEISNIAGSVEVSGWDRDEVHVTGRLGKGVERLEFDRDGGLVRIKVIYPKKSRNVGSTELEVSIPEQSRLSVNTVSAEIDVRGVRGSQRLESVSGDVETEAWAEDVEARTVSGDVRVNGHGDPALVTLTSVSGDVVADRVSGELTANAVSGDLEIDAAELSRARLKTTNGDIDLRAALGPNARFEVETINGDLELLLEAPVNAEFDIETFNGDIDNEFGPDPVRTSQYGPGRELRFTEGDGSARVGIKTLNGSVTLRKD